MATMVSPDQLVWRRPPHLLDPLMVEHVTWNLEKLYWQHEFRCKSLLTQVFFQHVIDFFHSDSTCSKMFQISSWNILEHMLVAVLGILQDSAAFFPCFFSDQLGSSDATASTHGER